MSVAGLSLLNEGEVRYNACMPESVPTRFSRRDLSLWFPLLAAARAGAQNAVLPSKTGGMGV